MKLIKIISSFLAVIIACFAISHAASALGDNALQKDSYTNAMITYRIAYLFNPIDDSIQKRLQATNVLLVEQQEQSEETSDLHTLATLPKGQYVLGTTNQVPVLMYHYIRVNPYADDKVGFNLSVTPYNFAAQLDYLVAKGYHTISLDELGANLLSKTPLPPKPIVLTFDDGYEDFYTAAYPILQKHNMKATNFVITGFVGLPKYLTWQQITEMQKSGIISFASHTVDHYGVTSLTDDQVTYEVTQSKKDLEKHLGYPINWLAYPYGDVNERTAMLTKKAGYLGAFGTKFGTFESTDSMFTEPRVRVGGGDSPESLGARLPW